MNPLEARTKAYETLMWLCDNTTNDKTALEAANSLLVHTDCDPLEEQMIQDFVDLVDPEEDD